MLQIVSFESMSGVESFMVTLIASIVVLIYRLDVVCQVVSKSVT